MHDERDTVGWLLRVSVAAAAAATAAIHFAVTGEHFGEDVSHGVFFLVVGWLQAGWAYAVLAGARRRVLLAGAAVQAAVVVVWALSRTTGLPLVPSAGGVEPVGVADALSTALELLCVVLVAALLTPVARRTVAPAARAAVASVTVLAVLASASTALAVGGGAHAHDHGTATTERVALMDTDAGPILLPTHTHLTGGEELVAGGSCTTPPTEAELQAARDLVNRTVAANDKYRSLAAARADGFTPNTPSGLPVVHYLNMRNYAQTFAGTEVLNPDAPQELVYANTAKGAVLVAVMYLMPPTAADPPMPAGCLYAWHVHTNLCFQGASVVALQQDGRCAAGQEARTTPPMMHVWMVPVDGGPLAPHVDDPAAVRAAEQVEPVDAGSRA